MSERFTGVNIHIYPSPIEHESRMLRITKALAQNFSFRKIILIGIYKKGLKPEEIIDEKRTIIRIPYRFKKHSGLLRKLLNNFLWRRDVLRLVRKFDTAMLNCHSLPVLPLCVAIKRRTKALLIYDTHELETETSGLRGLQKKLYEYTEKKFFPEVDFTFTVNDSIRDFYAKKYKTHRVAAIRNIPESTASVLSPSNIFREKFAIPPDEILFISQGILDKGRGVEFLLNVFGRINKHIIFLGKGELEDLISKESAVKSNIHFHPFVPPDEVLKYTSSADVGFSLVENTCLSYYYSLPNKFFEYIHAGLAVITNGPEQKKLIENYNIGWVAPESEVEFIDLLKNITWEQVQEKKRNTGKLQKELNWSNEELVLTATYTKLLAQDKNYIK